MIDYVLGRGRNGSRHARDSGRGGQADTPLLERRQTCRSRSNRCAQTLTIPTYWVRMPTTLSSAPGMHRFVWDLHETPPQSSEYGYPISAIPHDTPREPLGPAVLPGRYTVRLTAGGKTLTVAAQRA